MGIYVIAGLATGGVGFAAGMAVKGGVEAAVAQGKADALAAAAGTSASGDTQLVTSRQADEAQTEALVAEAFAVIDALTLGMEFKGVATAARQALAPGIDAVRTIELEEKVLAMETKLLGRVAPEEVEASAKEAREAANQAKQFRRYCKSGWCRRGRGCTNGQRPAERADKAATRIEKLAEAAKRTGVTVAEATLVKELEVALEGGGKIVITRTGEVFICASPCGRIMIGLQMSLHAIRSLPSEHAPSSRQRRQTPPTR